MLKFALASTFSGFLTNFGGDAAQINTTSHDPFFSHFKIDFSKRYLQGRQKAIFVKKLLDWVLKNLVSFIFDTKYDFTFATDLWSGNGSNLLKITANKCRITYDGFIAF